MSFSIDDLIITSSEKVLTNLREAGFEPGNLCAQAIGLSDFVGQSLSSNPELLGDLTDKAILNTQTIDYEQSLQQQLSALDLNSASAIDALHRTIRVFRKQHMLLLCCQDLLNLQDIEISLQKVSALADALIVQTYEWLYQFHVNQYGIPQGEFGPQPLIILGMGKLGGRELNFSSDIDLIFSYPYNGEIQRQRKPLEHQQFFTKIAQKLITALNQTTADGQVFRVDMRLRPFGDSGPLVMHFAAMEDYYQEQGREWERYAMVKARVLNKPCAYTQMLEQILKPFVYRRYLDYGAIDSLRKMKSLITQEVRRRGLKNNIKLGQGGIREVEFIVQSFQLIKGGRETDLQLTGLLNTLEKLVEQQLLPKTDKDQLKNSYLFLRKVEHCLQQFADQQTQVLPTDQLDQSRLCKVMSFASYQEFTEQLQQHMSAIHGQFRLLVGQSEEEEQPDDTDCDKFRDLWLLNLDAQEMQDVLSSWNEQSIPLGFYEQLIDFKQLLQKRRITTKGQDTLNKLMPSMLSNCFNLLDADRITESCEALLSRLITIFNAILGRTTYLQLLDENYGAQSQLVRLCIASPWIAEQISRFPILLDELLNPQSLYNPTEFDAYPSELRQMLLRVEPDDLEMQMEVLRQFKQIQQLKIAAADVTGALPIMKVSDHLTSLAEAIIAEVVNMAWGQMAEKYGVPPHTSEQDKCFAVIGYGKLGGIELGYSSDLDLVFTHNSQTQLLTNGDKPIESGAFYAKLAQRIMHLFMTNTPSGQLYEIDMRLRPSGNAGLLVCHIEGFKKYQLQEAWTWEHQALVRARIINASPSMAQAFNQIRKQILALPRDLTSLQTDVVSMRHKMRKNLSQGSDSVFDLKQDDGAMVDIEFLVQYWVLAHVQRFPKLCRWSDNVRIINDLITLHIIDEEDGQQLIEAYLTYRNTAHRLTLLGRKAIEQKSLFKDVQAQVNRIWLANFGHITLSEH